MFLILIGVSLLAQDIQRPTKSVRAGDSQRSASRYIFSSGGDAFLMTIKVWGEVRQPGIYEIPIGMDLVELISSAGGPTDRAKLTAVKVIRETRDSTHCEVLTINVKEFLNSGDNSEIPEMRPNDTVVVPLKPVQYFLTSLAWTQQVLSLVSVYALIQYYFNR